MERLAPSVSRHFTEASRSPNRIFASRATGMICSFLLSSQSNGKKASNTPDRLSRQKTASRCCSTCRTDAASASGDVVGGEIVRRLKNAAAAPGVIAASPECRSE
jgi:hypothetical protein